MNKPLNRKKITVIVIGLLFLAVFALPYLYKKCFLERHYAVQTESER